MRSPRCPPATTPTSSPPGWPASSSTWRPWWRRIYDAKRAQVYERLGIPTVATVPWTTDRLLRAIIPEGLISEWRDPSGTVTIVNLPYHRHWIGRPLAEFEAASACTPRSWCGSAVGCCRPHDTVVQEGDLIYASVLSKDIHDVGRQGRHLARGRSDADRHRRAGRSVVDRRWVTGAARGSR